LPFLPLAGESWIGGSGHGEFYYQGWQLAMPVINNNFGVAKKARLKPGFFVRVCAVRHMRRTAFSLVYKGILDGKERLRIQLLVNVSLEESMEKRKARVLIADDEPHIRSLISLIVTSLGAEVVGEATDGEQALSMYRQFSPDMVLLDINMPKVNGITVLKQIMAINNRTLVVMLTSLNALEVVKECIDNGAWNYILKNTTAGELNEAISATWGEYMAAIKAARATRATSAVD